MDGGTREFWSVGGERATATTTAPYFCSLLLLLLRVVRCVKGLSMMRDKMSRRGFVAGGLAAGVGVAGGVLSSSLFAEDAQAGTFVTAGPTIGAGSLKAHASKCGVLVGAA